ncbi:lysosome-associated membrane glycoprotein 2 isoform X2 [Anolis carolinensis]|uniref:lysosome-associated membrane glycoprotein 2 isoform X2 n=1 Tax=Anolis carolinensis TaxID=28377 RepID=UPI002F2B2FBC
MDARLSLFGRFLFPLALLLLDGSVLFQTRALDVEVRDEDNMTCLYAKLMVNISIKYETQEDTYKTVAFMLPSALRYDGSTCGNETSGPMLAVEFGDEHSWVISFAEKADIYQGIITFTYNTNDAQLFPDAKRMGLVTVSANYPPEAVKLDTVYSCRSIETIESDNVVQEIWDVTLQAFLDQGAQSNIETVCDKDIVVTTTVISTMRITALAVTAAANTPTAPPTPEPPLPPLPTLVPVEPPATGSYSLSDHSVTCLLATLGLQLNISQKVPLIINFNPNTTVASGSCGSQVSVLTLTDDRCKVDFVFAVKNTTIERFSLTEVNITVIESKNATLNAANRSLDYWDATVGSSYMCRKEETLAVTPGYKLNIFDLKVQPFDVKDNQYATAQECLLDDDAVLIPIVVGAALAALIVMIVVAYVIGRRKSYAGYQTL